MAQMKCKLNEAQYLKISRYLKDERRFKQKEIAAMCGVSSATVSRVKKTKSWADFCNKKDSRIAEEYARVCGIVAEKQKNEASEKMKELREALGTLSEELFRIACEFEKYADAMREDENDERNCGI